MNSNQQMGIAKDIIDQLERQVDEQVRDPRNIFQSPDFLFRKAFRNELIHTHHMDSNQANYVATHILVNMQGDIASHVIDYLAHEYAKLVFRIYKIVEGDEFAEEVILNNLEIDFKLGA